MEENDRKPAENICRASAVCAVHEWGKICKSNMLNSSVQLYMLSLRGLHISIPLTVILRCAVLKFFEHGTEIIAGGKPEGICQICDTDVGF